MYTANSMPIDKLMIADEWYEEQGWANALDAQSVNELQQPSRLFATNYQPRQIQIDQFNTEPQQETNSPVAENVPKRKPQPKTSVKLRFAAHMHMRQFLKRLKGPNINALTLYHYNVINDDSSSYKSHLTDLSMMQPTRTSRFRKLKSWFVKRGNRILQSTVECPQLPLIQPESQLKFIWDIIITAIRVFLFLMFTMEITFSNNILYHTLAIPLVITLFCLFMDIILQFNTAYFQQGQLVSSRTQIITNYISTDLFSDVISVILLWIVTIIKLKDKVRFIPSTEKVKLKFFPQTQTSAEGVDILQFAILLQIRNIFRVTRKIEEGFHFSRLTVTLLDLVKLIIVVMSFEHLFSCIWYYVGRQAYLNGQNSWIEEAGIGVQGYSRQYLYAFYFATVTMISVGYGDIVPTNDQERIVAIIFMFCSCIQLSYFVTSLFDIIIQLSRQSAAERVKLRAINLYMQKKHISQQLQVKVREYLAYVWQEQSHEEDSHQQDAIIGQLSSTLRDDLMLEANSLVLRECKLFSNFFSPQLKKKTLNIIHSLTLFPDVTLESQLNQELKLDSYLFFIETGMIRVEYEGMRRSQQNPKITTLGILGSGQNFGLDKFINGKFFWETFKSIGFTKLLYIQRSEFLEILRDFPEDYETFCSLKDGFQQKSLGLECFSCRSVNHNINECPILHYVPDWEKIIKTVQYDHSQRRSKKTTREKFTQFSSLQDLEFIKEVAEAFQFCHEELIDELYEDNNKEKKEELIEPQIKTSSKAAMLRSSMLRSRQLLSIKEDSQITRKGNSSSDEVNVPQQSENRVRGMSHKRQSKKLDELRPIIRGSKRKADLVGVVGKLKQAVMKINTMRRFSGSVQESLFIHRLKTVNNNEDHTIIVPPITKGQGSPVEKQAIELLFLKKRLILEESEHLKFSADFEVTRDYNIYKPEANSSNIVQGTFRTNLELFNRWSRYMLFPWTYIKEYLIVSSPKIKSKQSKKIMQTSRYSIYNRKIHPLRSERRQSKAFTLAEKRLLNL